MRKKSAATTSIVWGGRLGVDGHSVGWSIGGYALTLRSAFTYRNSMSGTRIRGGVGGEEEKRWQSRGDARQRISVIGADDAPLSRLGFEGSGGVAAPPQAGRAGGGDLLMKEGWRWSPEGSQRRRRGEGQTTWKIRRAQGGWCEERVACRTPFLTVVNIQRACTFARVLIILIVHFVLQLINSHLCSQMHSG
jgi:hypothetical protein